jgi:Tfp pilus assembly protein PilF
LLDIREPGFWKESLGIARRWEHRVLDDDAPAPAARVAQAPAAPATASAPSAAARGATNDVPGRRASETSPASEQPAIEAPVLAVVQPTPVPAAAAAGRAGRAVAERPHARPSRSDAALARQRTHGDPPGADVYARVDDAWRLNGAGDYADAWRVARTLPESSADPQILRLKALTALWAHENADARRLATTWHERSPADVEARFALAQAELQSGDVAAAEIQLAVLEREPLDEQRMLQLAMLQDWAGDRRGAIRSTRAVLASHADDPVALRRLAVLLEADGDDAEAATVTRRARAASPDDAGLELLAARLAAKLGERDAADEGYRGYVARHPGDVEGRLEAARHAVNAGHAELAADEYRAIVDARGPAGLRVELTRALLAAGRYAEAEEIARDAVASDEDGPEARLALAQSVYLQGRPRDAAPLFRDAQASAAQHPVDATYGARLAMARDQDLNAYGLLGDQLAGEAAPEPTSAATPADLWLLRGDVAKKRGDFRRARADYERAAELGAVLRAQVAIERLDEATRPEAGAGYAFFADANRLEVNGGALWAHFRPGDVARVGVQALAQVVSQHEARYTRTGGKVGFSELFLTPEWALDGGIGFINSSAGGGDLVTGNVAVRRYFAGGSVLGLTGYREPLLGAHEDMDPRLWNRIIDLEALGPSFAINGGKAYGDWLVSEERRDRVWAQLGAENYQDGNLRGIFYAHYQLPLRNGPENWTVVRPNAFVEAFKDANQPDYFSPETHATLGVAGHTVQRSGRFTFVAELNPQLLVTDGNAGFGVHGLLEASVQLGPANVGISGFAFYDSQDAYWLARAMAHVEVVF